MTTDGSLTRARVLIAHPSGRAREAMRDVLEHAGAVVFDASSRDEALGGARVHGADVLLLHVALGCAVAEVKSDPDLFRIAVVVVGEAGDVASTLDALEHGAHDVLRDDAPPAELVARVRAARRAQEMQEHLLSREHDLEVMAYHDELTGVANRRYAVRQLHALLSRARRHGQELSVVLLDADGFKALNDRHGHGAGDDVLRGLAARLRSRVREEDIVARESPERLVARADRGLYAAKEAGRDCVRPGDSAGAPSSR